MNLAFLLPMVAEETTLSPSPISTGISLLLSSSRTPEVSLDISAMDHQQDRSRFVASKKSASPTEGLSRRPCLGPRLGRRRPRRPSSAPSA